MRVASLFAGIGGFDLALERLGHEVVYANEWDRFAADIYDQHFTTKTDRRDITTVEAEELPAFDLLCGGFPCQSFSVAGRRLGFEEARGTLFFDIARIAKAKRPAYLLLENVKGLLSHDLGRTFAVILRTLDALGYDLAWQVCNSKDFGVPQNRERVYLVGHLRGRPRPEVFPLTGPATQTPAHDPAITISRGFAGRLTVWRGRSTALRDCGSGGNKTPMVARTAAVRGRTEGARRELRNDGLGNAPRTAGGGSRPLLAYRGHRINQPEALSRALTAGVHGVPGGDGLVVVQRPRGKNRGGRSTTAPTVQRGMGDGNITVNGVRRLTPTECERLQGFPDGWTAEGVNGPISDTQRYKQLGNAVTVDVVSAIAQRAFGRSERTRQPRTARNHEQF